MPNTKKASAKSAAALEVVELPQLQCAADGLFRTASESCRQQAHLSRILDLSCSDEELKGVLEVHVMLSRLLEEAVERYGTMAANGHDGLDEGCWHAANALWHASREYARRHIACNLKSAKLSRHSPTQLGELAVEYELKASAVLALRYAVDEYAKRRPEAR